MMRFLITCREASLLASKKIDKELSLTERLILNIHRFRCAAFSAYPRQLQLIHDCVRQIARRGLPLGINQDIRLDDGRKKIITSLLGKTPTGPS